MKEIKVLDRPWLPKRYIVMSPSGAPAAEFRFKWLAIRCAKSYATGPRVVFSAPFKGDSSANR